MAYTMFRGDRNILIVGGDSLIGRALRRKLDKDYRVFVTTREPSAKDNQICLDLMAPDRFIVESRVYYDTVVLCAGLSSIAYCQNAPEASNDVNVVGLGEVIAKLKCVTDRFIFLSSDQVYDGETRFPSPADQVSPRSEYGKQKVAVEQLLTAQSLQNCIIRLTKVIDKSNHFFVSLSQAINAQQPFSVYANYSFSPLSLEFAVRGICEVIEGKISGITHLSGDSDVTYSEAADYLVAHLGGCPDLLKKVTCEPDTLPAGYKQFISLGGSLLSGGKSDVGLGTLDCFFHKEHGLEN
jgi:dTDP-4-dehydrorhamnose reductase